ncbi:MAG: helix-turn-helix domain-containing protein [Rhodospirillales bacterium]|nr:helix-turn-helix domain-containing protein [Rhodospirillales bacterium]
MLDDIKGITPLPEVAIVPETIDVLSIRQRIGLSQAAFATRFGISKRTLQEWEQGRHAPDAMARAFLTVIAKEPDAVRRALAA